MLYTPFLDPRHPERVKVYTRMGNTVRIEAQIGGRSVRQRFTMLAADFLAYEELVKYFAEQGVEAEKPATRRKKKEAADADIPSRVPDGEGVSG